MEHDAYVPFPVGSVRAALAERERVARCVPGLQLDATAGTGDSLEGRLRVRIGGSTITYRGSLTLIPQGDGFTVEGSGTEARGSGSAKLSLKLVPRAAEDGGTHLHCSGTVTGDGRIAEHPHKTAAAAGTRLLDRFCTALAESLATPSSGAASGSASGATPADDDGGGDAEAPPAAGIGEPGDNDRAIPGIPGPEKGDRDAATAAGDTGTGASGAASTGGTAGGTPGGKTTGGIFETDVPPPSPDPGAAADEGAADEAGPGAEEAESPSGDAGSAEAAHARRTMIGRSAEEVDHAPPRGRYAPVPSPEASATSAALRWAAPAAAAVLAGAVVLTRVLRRRN